MRVLPLIALSLPLALGLSSPAAASAVPPVEFRAGQTVASAGWTLGNTIPFTLDLDHALSERQSLGVSYAPLGNWWAAAVRTTTRLDLDTYGASWGLTLSGGPGYFPLFDKGAYALWFQPALAFSMRLFGSNFYLRGSSGPVLTAYLTPTGPDLLVQPYLWPIWTNGELAYRFDDRNELTFGTIGSMLGYRATF